ncbi:hypothetical protein SAMN05421856_101676 [Chryseobacterium taichungense]|uniref:Uncharacterized protein n=1 Tax=Chryseobacterium taichungense TaxID=295069 RepID=A0A1H7WDX4_9FLAO|nr:hypothetical protein [Chryseobacterium taichungense]SEM19713.1 hypothetical protein SAMN05421856_101676 [Chryseobacterium taichungense]
MKKRLSTLIIFCVLNLFKAQVGINTTSPTATLDIVGKNQGGVADAKDGIVIPRVSKITNVSGNAKGQMVYLTANDVSLVPGYVFWDGTNWKQLGGASLTLSNFSASSPLIYNSTTGSFSINQSNSSSNGYLSSADWNILMVSKML